MREKRWLLAGLGAVLLAGGCGGTRASARIDEQQLAQLSEEQQAPIVTASRNAEIAEANLSTMKMAREEAKQFRQVAAEELSAAEARLEAARAGVDLGRSASHEETLGAAQRNEELARRQVIAARAKLDYAERLLQLREAKIDETAAALEAARADLKLIQFRTLQRNELASGLDERAFLEPHRRTQEMLATQRLRVAQLDSEVAVLKSGWEERRRDFNTAMREVGRPVIRVPPPPQPMPPATGANEGPSQPMGVPEPEPEGTLAPMD